MGFNNKNGKKSFDKGGKNRNEKRFDRGGSFQSRKSYNDGNGYEEGLENGSVPGRNAVRELLKSGRTIEKIYVQAGEREGSITVLAAEALNKGIPLIEVEKAKLDSMSGFAPHTFIKPHFPIFVESSAISARSERSIIMRLTVASSAW